MTRDDLKEKVASAIYKHQREFNERPSNDFDCQPSWLRGAMLDAAEAALSAIEGAGMAVVPVEATDEMYWAGLKITRDPGYGHVHDAAGGAVYRAMVKAGGVS